MKGTLVWRTRSGSNIPTRRHGNVWWVSCYGRPLLPCGDETTVQLMAHTGNLVDLLPPLVYLACFMDWTFCGYLTSTLGGGTATSPSKWYPAGCQMGYWNKKTLPSVRQGLWKCWRSSGHPMNVPRARQLLFCSSPVPKHRSWSPRMIFSGRWMQCS